MAIEFEKKVATGAVPVFWRGECKTLPGDFTVKGNLPDGTVIKKGTPIKLDFSKMECTLCKAVKVVAGGTTAAPRVKKNHAVVVGDELSIGSAKQKVNAIDDSNAEYDVLTLAAALTGATENAVAVVGTDVPNAVVEKDKVINNKMGFNTVSAGYDVVVLKEIAPAVADEWLVDGYCMKNNPSIKFIKQ